MTVKGPKTWRAAGAVPKDTIGYIPYQGPLTRGNKREPRPDMAGYCNPTQHGTTGQSTGLKGGTATPTSRKKSDGKVRFSSNLHRILQKALKLELNSFDGSGSGLGIIPDLK
jgi:hypothetical protein